MRSLFLFIVLLLTLPAGLRSAEPDRISLSAIGSPVLFRGDATTAYRDPTAIYHDGWFLLFFTLVRIESDGRPFSYTAWSKSRDLVRRSEPVIFTPRDQNLNYGSPGNIIRYGDRWELCLHGFHGSDYPENDPRGGFDNFASIGVARSDNLETWTWPGKNGGSMP